MRGSPSIETTSSPSPRAVHLKGKEQVRSQREKDLARDIKLALRTDQWNKLPELLMDWEMFSNKDILIECGIQFAAKERAMCEKILEHVARRGPLKGSEYPYASALIHLADCYFYLSKFDSCIETLRKGINYIESRLRLIESESKTCSEWRDLKDWASVFLAVMSYRRGQYDNALHILDKTSNYEMVLRPGRFAFFTLLKAKCLLKLGHHSEAVKALSRRQSQEDALVQVEKVRHEDAVAGMGFTSIQKMPKNDGNTSSRERVVPKSLSHIDRASSEDVPSASKSYSDVNNTVLADSVLSVRACHDLHVSLLISLGNEEEAKELFAAVRNDGSKRGALTAREFAKRVKLDDVGKALIESWQANLYELQRKI
ncbi:hypothetical protein DFJ73DRAFT_830441 [Zopfochytrium polystomum]|nr:hypothetical protein DFJ73DRAFT_830441 [Zopfochytrium polystomum]